MGEDPTPRERLKEALAGHDPHPAITETLPAHTPDEQVPTATQPAFHAVVHLVVPGVDRDGQPVDEAYAQDYIFETLRDRFLDWGYVRESPEFPHELPGDPQTPVQITVSKPYVEGTFLSEEEDQ